MDTSAQIISHTCISWPQKKTAHKLAKKDCDLSLLKFVSFKIGLFASDFDILIDHGLNLNMTWSESSYTI